MSETAGPDATALANGWRGFDSIGERVDRGYLYGCDGMPTQMGCGAQIILPRRLSRVGKKSTGWLVCYGQDFDGTDGRAGASASLEAHRAARRRQDGPDAPAYAQAHVRDDDARRGRGHPGRADRSPSRRPAHDDEVRPGARESRPARQLHPRGLHGRSDLDRHADALATLAGFVRRAFIGEAR